MNKHRTGHLYYRCHKCGRGMTCLQVEARWDKAEAKGGEHPELCPCGSRQLSPGNPLWWEELLYPSIWKLWYERVYKEKK